VDNLVGSRTGGRNSGDQEPVSRITEDLLDALPEVAPLAEEDVEVGRHHLSFMVQLRPFGISAGQQKVVRLTL
jgi:hypothetical protein